MIGSDDFLSGVPQDWNDKTPQDIVREELDALKERITKNSVSAGQRVTGKTLGSMVVTTGISGDVINGEIGAWQFFGILETGSGPWRKVPMRETKSGKKIPTSPRWFTDIIARWLEAKGLSYNAFLVARGIILKGSRLHREGGRTDIYSNEIPATVENIKARIAGLYEAQMMNSLLRNKETKI
jgi:hypothetical protein